MSSLCFYDNLGEIFSDVHKISGSFICFVSLKVQALSFMQYITLLSPPGMSFMFIQRISRSTACCFRIGNISFKLSVNLIVCVVFWYWSSWLVDVGHMLFYLELRSISFSLVGWIWFWFLSNNDLIMCRFLLILLCLVYLKNIYWYVPHMLQWSLRFTVLCF